MFCCLVSLWKNSDKKSKGIYKRNMDKSIEEISYEDTIPFLPEITSCKVVKVYDGDTITIATQLQGLEPFYRFSVRLRGIDSPEIKGHSEKEKAAAIVSRDALSNLVFNKRVMLQNIGTEKYGRLLADVHYGEIHINQWMLDNKLAVPYDGGTKTIQDF
jgi:endonuclease YncB( thermonuclease family)